ncbi:hypothetical protein ASPSYDRAFT_1053420 [Aspergillus sydowii CBS 593.65]|uniref:Uncharacterized protein n=1 Tax=Aspergillus sydowii CBS 593.65 TaxID=1036612 RepID=A0A1L9TDH2_9EURO|nr:uncharacterized protein ASPSYDRAFT_1053420 [Aspergillus sydowii CBS 593.65]OJJ57445.1 hypothetical protein ASPSYDRAFT_1053420 [Aspergillus sydowii CBS 593.65]
MTTTLMMKNKDSRLSCSHTEMFSSGHLALLRFYWKDSRQSNLIRICMFFMLSSPFPAVDFSSSILVLVYIGILLASGNLRRTNQRSGIVIHREASRSCSLFQSRTLGSQNAVI